MKVNHSKTIKALALPRRRQALAMGTRCSVAGWGLTQHGGELARKLQELDVRVLDNRMCNNSRFWHGDITPSMVCLEMEAEKKGPCKVKQGGQGVGAACGRGPPRGASPPPPWGIPETAAWPVPARAHAQMQRCPRAPMRRCRDGGAERSSDSPSVAQSGSSTRAFEL